MVEGNQIKRKGNEPLKSHEKYTQVMTAGKISYKLKIPFGNQD